MRRRKKRTKHTLSFAIAIILLIAVGAFCLLNKRDVVSNKYEVTQQINIKDNKYASGILGNKIVVFEKNLLKIYDYEGKKQSKKINKDQKQQEINTLKDRIFLTDIQSGKIIIWNDQLEKIKEINIKEEILLIKEDKNDQYLGIHTKRNDGTERILMITKDGEIAGEISGFKKGKVIDYSFNSKKEMVAIAVVSYNTEYSTNILITDIQGKILGGKMFKNEIIPKIFLTNESEIICVATNRIIKLNKNKEIQWENSKKVDKVGYSQSNDTLILCEEGITNTKVTLLNTQNTVLYEAPLDGKIKKIVGNAKRTILYGNRTICDVSKTSLNETKINKDIEWAEVTDNGNIVICDNKRIEILKEIH